jgi:hypothetical protein
VNNIGWLYTDNKLSSDEATIAAVIQLQAEFRDDLALLAQLAILKKRYEGRRAVAHLPATITDAIQLLKTEFISVLAAEDLAAIIEATEMDGTAPTLYFFDDREAGETTGKRGRGNDDERRQGAKRHRPDPSQNRQRADARADAVALKAELQSA